MALVINNRVRETTATTGTGAQTLAGAVDGFQTFSAGIGNDNTTYYAISLNTENEWEVGLGTLNSDSSTLTRTTVLESSNSDSAVDFSAGSKEIFCTLPSEKAVYLDASDNQVGGFASLAADTTPQLGGDLDVNGNAIVSASNGAIAINANGTGTVTMTTNSVTGEVIPGKLEGTNFTDSLIVGHSTTGTLSSASNNTAVGIDAMDAITTGDNNVAIGTGALTANTTGKANIMIGSLPGRYMTTNSHYNIAIGGQSLEDAGASTTVALGNIAVGHEAFRNITSGDYNIGLGYQIGGTLTTGSGNVIIGSGIDTAAADSARTLQIAGYDGSTTTTWISGDGDGNVEIAPKWNPSLSTTGKALVMGF
jgi:hypothetical protein